MLSPQLQQKVNDLWNMLWSSGMTNPLTSIEQITYLIFLKRLETLDEQRKRQGKLSLYGPRLHCSLPHHPDEDKTKWLQELPEGANPAEYCAGHEICRWSYVLQGNTVSDPSDLTGKRMITPHDHLTLYVFPWMHDLENIIAEKGNGYNGTSSSNIGTPMSDAYFQLPREKTNTLQRAVALVDQLFASVGTYSAHDDLMGDIFEYLLSEIKSSGKNGQFRTPRHIIRFMIELLDPQPGQPIVDPAAGTGGFLTNSIQHLLKKATDPETLLLEWDGTPHRAYGGNLDTEKYIAREYFTGYDNDRTMVRIGWMNMVLRSIDQPRFELRDSLGKKLPDSESKAYAYVLANPPFTGTVDKDDLHEEKFPRNPRNTKEPITNKSELLFIWLILDLLQVGGRAAVIVPEGVLFGSTGAHKALRRELVLKHCLEGVISLPAGVFQPYTGVKTSILVFQKVGEMKEHNQPQTEHVWFYEVTADGYTLDARRKEKPEPNDLWDALAKWPDKVVDSYDYYQPTFEDVRWRLVDEKTIAIFPNLAKEKDQTLGIHEMFRELPFDPKKATSHIVSTHKPIIDDLYQRYLAVGETEGVQTATTNSTPTNAFRKRALQLNTIFRVVMQGMLEKEEYLNNYGRKELNPLVKAAGDAAIEHVTRHIGQAAPGDRVENSNEQDDSDERDSTESTTETQDTNEANNWKTEVEAIVHEFAKLDGYDVRLRSPDVFPHKTDDTKSWSVAVRLFLKRDDWQSADGTLNGSHDEDGNVRVEYLLDPDLYTDDKETVKSDYLDPDCLEAHDFNLSAGRYKPFTLKEVQYDHPVKIIEELQEIEGKIQDRLNVLEQMIRGV